MAGWEKQWQPPCGPMGDGCCEAARPLLWVARGFTDVLMLGLILLARLFVMIIDQSNRVCKALLITAEGIQVLGWGACC